MIAANLRLDLSRALICFVALLLFTVPTTAWEHYLPETLDKIVAGLPSTEGSDYLVTAGSFSYRVRASYVGQHRSLSKDTQTVIRGWVDSLRLDPEIPAAFVEEFAFEAEGKTYWLAIQKPLMQPMLEDLRPGMPVDLYVQWIGSTRQAPVFLVNRFDT